MIKTVSQCIEKSDVRECKVVLPTQRYAEICKEVIGVDEELQPDLVNHEVQLADKTLIMYFAQIE